MKFVNKHGLIMEVDLVCANLFQSKGWEPYTEVAADTVTDNTPLDSEALTYDAVNADVVVDVPTNPKLTRREVMRMTKDSLLSTAKERNYTITSDKRTEIIEEFLKQQG